MDLASIQYSMEIVSEGATHAGGPKTEPDAVDLQHFNEQFNGGSSPDLSPLSMPAADTSLGDKVLSGIQNVKAGYDHQINEVTKTLSSSEPLAMKDMLKLQVDLANLTLRGELINKTVSKSTQNIDTLLKSQ